MQLQDEQIKIEKIVAEWQERIEFLERYNDLLDDGIRNKVGIGEQATFETREWCMQRRDLIHKHRKEIESKKQYIKAYQDDLAMRKQAEESRQKQFKEGFGSVISELRNTVVEDKLQDSMKRGILKRFDYDSYGSEKEKQADFELAVGIIQKATAPKELKKA